MAVSYTLTRPDRFPEGTSVGAYPVSNWPTGIVDPGAAPPGSATNSQTVSSGSVTFTGLTSGTTYYAYALVSGDKRYVSFTAGADSLPLSRQTADNVAITGGSIAGITDLALADGGTGASTAANARTNLQVTDAWKDVVGIQTTRGQSTVITGAGTYTFSPASGVALATSVNAGTGVFTFDPAWYTITGRTLNLRCIWGLNTNDVAPAISFTFGLYPVSAVAGASGSNSTITLGTVVTGTTATFTTPAADTQGTFAVTSGIAAPSAGQYILGLTASGADTSGASIITMGRVQVQNV